MEEMLNLVVVDEGFSFSCLALSPSNSLLVKDVFIVVMYIVIVTCGWKK